MRVVDLDRDMSDVIPTGTSLDSEFLFERMTDVTLQLARAAPERRILDVASGIGQDSVSLAERGAWVVGAEPSARMIGLASLWLDKRRGEAAPAGPDDADEFPLAAPVWVRGWGDSLPFASDSFDAAICKGALDHFDRPGEAIGEMARVVKPRGRVVLAIANFESLACRVCRGLDEFDQDWRGRECVRGRRGYDCPSDHFTRYEIELMKEQAREHIELEVVHGISLGWGLPAWSRFVSRLPRGLADRSFQVLDALARRWPSLADVIVLAGRPRRSATTSA